MLHNVGGYRFKTKNFVHGLRDLLRLILRLIFFTFEKPSVVEPYRQFYFWCLYFNVLLSASSVSMLHLPYLETIISCLVVLLLLMVEEK
jgi:hypothetical protein